MKCILFVCLLLSQNLFADDDIINWTVPSFAPVFMDNQNGYLDYYLQEVQRRLPTFKHKIIKANFARTIELMKSKKNICTLSLLKSPEREMFAAFTEPYIVIHANHIIMKKNAVSKNLIENNQMNLEALLKTKKKIGVSFGRSYGIKTDKILKKYADSGLLDIRRGANGFEGLFGLLELGRIDAIIGYRAELDWYSDGKSPMVSYEIKNEDRYFSGHAACSKSEWGKQTVEQINKILLSIRKDQNFYGKYLVFIKGVDLKEYSLQVHKFFKK